MAQSLGDTMREEFGEEGGPETATDMIRKAGGMILYEPAKVPSGSGVIDATMLFPGDEYDDAEQLPDGMYEDMEDGAVPFWILAVGPRDHPKYGQFWRVVIQLDPAAGDPDKIFSVAYSYDEAYRNRNEKLAATAYALMQGNRRVGPFVFTLGREGDSGNRFKSLRAYRLPPETAKRSAQEWAKLDKAGR